MDAGELFLGITVYFASHEAEAITPAFKELFHAADIIVTEQGFTEDDDLSQNLLGELSRGNLTIDDVLKITHIERQQYPDFTRGLFSLIFRSGKTILPERPPFHAGDIAAQTALERQVFRDIPLGKACRLYAENLAKRAAFQKKRDEALVQQLVDVVAKNPSSNVLVVRGVGHQPSVESALAARRVAVTVVTSHIGMVVLFSDELLRKVITGGRPTKRELLRSLVEQVETRTSSFRPNQIMIRIVRARVGTKSELQCEKYLRKKLNLT